MHVEIFGLLYGDHPELHARFLDGLSGSLILRPPDVGVTLWLNQVCKPTLDLLPGQHTFRLRESADVNVPKYTAMREMFAGIPDDCEWIVWLDDDVRFTDRWWLDKTLHFIRSKHDGACYIGQPWWVDHLPGQREFIKASRWFRGRAWELNNKGVPGIRFAQGSYWWLRNDVRKLLDWPDERLSRNGGDTLLGEAVRQQGLPFHHFHEGVKPNDHKRRGLSEAPAGCTNPNIRR
jgi:hypothetical protein